MIQVLEHVSLEPVLELEPGSYSTRERESPQRSGQDAPAEWDAYWRACLGDSGLGQLANLRPGSWQVPIRGIGETELHAILSKSVHAPLEKLLVDEDPVVNGGFALLDEGKPAVEAQCCGDLGVLESWADLAAHKDGWTRVWIGHPQLSARVADGWLELSKPDDDKAPEVRWKLRPEALDAGVKSALAGLEAFLPKVIAVLRTVPGLNGIEPLARDLIGLGQWTRWKR